MEYNLNLKSKIFFFKVASALVIITFVFLHLLNIHADTPAFMVDKYEPGILVDEGLKALDARNLALFGSTHWTPHDRYPTWLKKSPVTVISNLMMFKLLDVSISTARLCSLLFALGTLILFYALLIRIYSYHIALLTLALLVINTPFFFYSRTSLLEIKVIFFMICALYCLFTIKTAPRRWVLTLVFLLLAYLSKSTAIIFFVALLLHKILTAQNHYILNKILRPQFLLILLIITIIVFYLIETNFKYFVDIKIMGNQLRNPVSAFLPFPALVFVKRVPILTFLSLIYIVYTIVRIIENIRYDEEELFFIVWLIMGILAHSIFVYQAVRYYVVILIPMSLLSAKTLLSFREIFNLLLSRGNRIIKGVLVTLCFSFGLVFLGRYLLYPFLENSYFLVFIKTHFYPFSFLLLFFLGTIYWVMSQYYDRISYVISKFSTLLFACFLAIFLSVHLPSIFSWVSHPKHNLQEISSWIDSLDDNSIIAGLWASQAGFDTKKRILVSHFYKFGINFYNLEQIRPDFLVAVDFFDLNFVKKFQERYPGVLLEPPLLTHPYAGQMLRIYQLDF